MSSISILDAQTRDQINYAIYLCLKDGMKKEQLPYEVRQTLRAIANQVRDGRILKVADDVAAINQLVAEYKEPENPDD